MVLDNEWVWGGCTKKSLTEWLDFDPCNENLDDQDYFSSVTKPFLIMLEARK